MTDESTTMPDQSRTSESRSALPRSSGSSQSTTLPSKPGSGDPARHDFGDKPDKAPVRADPSKTEDSSVKRSEQRFGGEGDDAGEGHKGPRVDATSGSAAKTEGDKTAR